MKNRFLAPFARRFVLACVLATPTLVLNAQTAIERLDPLERGLGELARAQLAEPDQVGELARRPEQKIQRS